MYPTQNAPVFYPTMPQRPVMFPGSQMVPGRWQGRVGQPMMGMPPRAINYQLMPIPNSRGGQGGPNQRQRGNRRGGKGPQGQGPQGQQVRYNPNVRNQQQAQPQMQQQNVQGPSAVTNPANQPLTIKTLAAAPEEQKKQMIGERLFPLIKEMHAELAGKITGMLLEMDNGELIHLLESREALNLKVEEALHVLEMHEEDEEEDEEDEEDAQ